MILSLKRESASTIFEEYDNSVEEFLNQHGVKIHVRILKSKYTEK